jgi:protein involved in polysaccharide export with SLBB domain
LNPQFFSYFKQFIRRIHTAYLRGLKNIANPKTAAYHYCSRSKFLKIMRILSVIFMAVAATAAVPQASAQIASDLNPLNSTVTTGVGVHKADQLQKVKIGNSTVDNSAETSTTTGGTQTQGVRSLPPNEFQRFVAESTGMHLPLYGEHSLSSGTHAAPPSSVPPPPEHPLGPGDEILIRGWGSIELDHRVVIDRNGLISVPTVGTIVLGGVKAGDAESVIRANIERLYRDVKVSVTFGQLRTISVYVVGQARNPGTYRVSSLSTVLSVLFQTGGPNAIGSLRRLQVKRANGTSAEFDLYAFLSKGDKSADIRLHDGDTVFIPPALGFVALVGKVNQPAVYELRSNQDTLQSLLEVAGGLPVVADPRRAFIERIDPSAGKPRTVEQFALDKPGLERYLRNGDLVNITSITPEFANAVTLRGNVDQPVRAPFRPGMRVRDLIPSKDYLVTRSALARQNSAVLETTGSATIASRIGATLEQINWDYAVIERINKNNLQVELIPFNLGKVFDEPTSENNRLLQAGDTVTIFSHTDVAMPVAKRRVFVRVEGEVQVPGVYQMSAGDTIHSLVAKAGGPTREAYLFGTAFYREQTRREQALNLVKAADRLERQMLSERSQLAANRLGQQGSEAISAAAADRSGEHALARLRQLQPSGRITLGLDPVERSFNRMPNLKLEDGDRLVIPNRPDFINVFGAVNVEASPVWREGLRVRDYLQMAGVSQDADLDAVFVLRADGSVMTKGTGLLSFGGVDRIEIMPGDSIVVPELLDKETKWSKFVRGARDWTQIIANFGIGAAAVKVLRD